MTVGSHSFWRLVKAARASDIGLIYREHAARRNREAARRYVQFLEEYPEERAVMETWDKAPPVDDVEAGPS